MIMEYIRKAVKKEKRSASASDTSRGMDGTSSFFNICFGFGEDATNDHYDVTATSEKKR